MTTKSWRYAQYEGIVQAMRELGEDTLVFQGGPASQSFPNNPTIDLREEFQGSEGIDAYTHIDELWYTGAALGAALSGVRAINYQSLYMANAYMFHLIGQHAGKLPHMTGGQALAPIVFILHISGQSEGMAGQHSDYECDTWYMSLPGVKTIIPSTVYDAKGLMVSAVKTDDPVVYLDYGRFPGMTEDIPDDYYEVPIGEAVVRKEGDDLTIVSSGGGMPPVLEAADRLEEEGINAEVIDLRTLHPMDGETIADSVEKTGKLLTVDQSTYCLCPGSEVIARVAQAVPGARFKKLARPDAPPSGALEQFRWQIIDAENVYDNAKYILS